MLKEEVCVGIQWGFQRPGFCSKGVVESGYLGRKTRLKPESEHLFSLKGEQGVWPSLFISFSLGMFSWRSPSRNSTVIMM